MNQTTVDVIAICKFISCKYNTASARRNVTNYMADINNRNVDTIQDWEVDQFIKNVLLDYVDNADTPSKIIDFIFCDNGQVKMPIISRTTKMLIAFSYIQVVDDKGNYVNGFTKELLNQMDINVESDVVMR